jgi:hypothetical protein
MIPVSVEAVEECRYRIATVKGRSLTARVVLATINEPGGVGCVGGFGSAAAPMQSIATMIAIQRRLLFNDLLNGFDFSFLFPRLATSLDSRKGLR